MNYRVAFEIDVDAETPQHAVITGWQLLGQTWLPVGVATDEDGHQTTVDLQAMKDCATAELISDTIV